MTSVLYAGILQAVLFGANEAPVNVPETAIAGAKTEQSVAKDDSYDEARRVTTETGRPMVVMVGTDWCGPCQMMKKTILPRVREHGLLRRVAFALVNADRQRDLAEKLTGGGPVPQLVMFRKTPEGWMRRKLVGGQSVEAVEEFINEGLAADAAENKHATPTDSKARSSSEHVDKTTLHLQDAIGVEKKS